MLDDLLATIPDTGIADVDIGGLIGGGKIGWNRLRAALPQASPRLPRCPAPARR